jgi:hypothetical protein
MVLPGAQVMGMDMAMVTDMDMGMGMGMVTETARTNQPVKEKDLNYNSLHDITFALLL